ncbi:hypothetical protein ABZ464_51780 [Streptomyces sp. NPDC005820]|uniref:hypothetical protein n=1 Tax=Streptomyces sp. NPDC005820 TaxID=3157069 RepID=UPI0033F56422
MSSVSHPSRAKLARRLHHQYVERHVTAAQAAAAELGIGLEVESIRSALAYEPGFLLRLSVKIGAPINVALVALIKGDRGACTPGGWLEPLPDVDCTGVHAPLSTQLVQFNILIALLVGVLWLVLAGEGNAIPRCSKPIYPLLGLLAASADVARPTTRYTEAINLSQRVSLLGLPLRTFARNAAADFGNRRTLRRALAMHLNRVDATFIRAADQLASDREASARKLAELAALAANNIAAGRFTAVLPPTALAEEAPVEPDRLDGRRLATACLWAAIVTASFLSLSPLGAPVELLVPLALVWFPVLVYTLLAFRYGLSEATRLTRSIGGFFSASPPL